MYTAVSDIQGCLVPTEYFYRFGTACWQQLGAGESTAGGLVSEPCCWGGFGFSQVESCLHRLPILIFLQIKPVCSVVGGGERDFDLKHL